MLETVVSSRIIREGINPLDILAQELDVPADRSVLLRSGLIHWSQGKVVIESGRMTVSEQPKWPAPLRPIGSTNSSGLHVAIVIPTGVGASVGGFLGDAGPLVRAMEAVADTVIVHPNVVNASDLFGGSTRVLYVDGFTLDEFFLGRQSLAPVARPVIGLLLDRTHPKLQAKLINSANAMVAVRGAAICGYAVCDERVHAVVTRSPHGHYVGRVTNPEVLFRAAYRLTDAGANCIAVVTEVDGISSNDWRQHYLEGGPNPVGAIEALISRSITYVTGVPCAHAPANIAIEFGSSGDSEVVDPRAAAEPASGTGLPCLLHGMMQLGAATQANGIRVEDLAAVIVPDACAGGAPAVGALRAGVPLVTVKSNTCSVGVRSDRLRVPSIQVEDFTEAIAFVACRRAKVDWRTVKRPLQGISRI